MAINKIVHSIHGTLLDISQDSITSNVLLEGYTAHGADGELIEGTFNGGVKEVSEFLEENADINTIYKVYDESIGEYKLYMHANDIWLTFLMYNGIEPGLYATGSDYEDMLWSWEELLNSNLIAVDNNMVYYTWNANPVEPKDLPEINEYGFYFGVPYSNGYNYEIIFYEDGSVQEYFYDELDGNYEAGSASYSMNTATLPNGSTYTFPDERNMVWDDDDFSIVKPISLRGDLALPDDGSVLYIGDYKKDDDGNCSGTQYGFYNCRGLTEITIPEAVLEINNSAFGGCRLLKRIDIPDTIIRLGSGVFAECDSLTEVILPSNLDKIRGCTFTNCDLLTTVNIPESVTVIGEYAFEECSILNSIIIPQNVTLIDGWAFNTCPLLQEVTILASTPPTLGQEVFGACDNLTAIKVPASSVDTYKSADGWSEYADIIVSI